MGPPSLSFLLSVRSQPGLRFSPKLCSRRQIGSILLIWPPLILGGVVALLRPFKAMLIALQFKYKARVGGGNSFD
jgi:uncharacterized protein (DUF983 family)